jgi:hypothetical protein
LSGRKPVAKAAARPIGPITLDGRYRGDKKEVAVREGFAPELKSKFGAVFSWGEGRKKVLMRPSGEGLDQDPRVFSLGLLAPMDALGFYCFGPGWCGQALMT